jgi:hypothetical protein
MKTRLSHFPILLLAAWSLLQVPSPLPARDNQGTSPTTIKDVMITAYKEKLAKRVIQGEATSDDKERLLKLYQALAEARPPRGSRTSWQKKTGALVQAAQAAIEGQANAPMLLKKTMECGACHATHK